MTQAPDDLVGQLVEDRYRIEAPLGSGGMGVVYRARHVKVGREVAIKVLHDHLLSDPTMVERFEREAALAARLAHRNLVSVIDVGETPAKQKLMVLELARGETLAEIVARGALSSERVIAVTSQLLAGLQHAHEAGLVHRDLKPENVIVEVDEHGHEVPKIVDFGVALLRGDERRLTTAGVVLGTPQYMAPEHAQGHAVDSRTDLFALGVMVYEMLGGKLPFDGSGVDVALANITQEPPAIRARTGVDADPLLEAFARRLMARRVRDRFQSARAALDVLELIDEEPAAAREILIPAVEPRVTPNHRITALGTQAPRARPRPASAPHVRARGSTPPRGERASSEATFAARALASAPSPVAAPERVDPATDVPRVFTARPLALTSRPHARVFAGRALTVGKVPRSQAESERLALAATLEAEGTPRRRRKAKRIPQPTRPWQPWKSFGLLVGAAFAALLLASIAITRVATARTPSDAVPAIALPSAAIAPRISIRTTVHEVADPRGSRTAY